MGKIIEQQDAPLLVAPMPMGLEMESEPTMLPVTDNMELKPLTTTTSLPSTPTTRSSSKRRVHFSVSASDDVHDDDNDVIVVEHCYEKELDETTPYAPLWYNNEEYAAIRETNYAIMRELRQLMMEDCWLATDMLDMNTWGGWTWRGFEYVLHKYPRKHMRQTHSSNVLHFQQVLEYGCPTALADYTANSSSACGSSDRARKLALQDEQEATLIYNELDDEQQPQNEQDDNNSALDASQTSIQCRRDSDTTLQIWRTVRKFFLCI